MNPPTKVVRIPVKTVERICESLAPLGVTADGACVVIACETFCDLVDGIGNGAKLPGVVALAREYKTPTGKKSAGELD